MARPKRDTVDYFTHDCDASGKKTLKIMRGQFGLVGVGFWWSLLEYLGHAEGHVLDMRDPSDLEFLLRELGCDVVSGTEMLDKLAFLGAIDKTLWQHRVIWSQNFVDRLADVYKKRIRPLPSRPCFCDGNCNHPLVSPDISGAETHDSAAGIPQSKLDNSILDNTILDKSVSSPEIETVLETFRSLLLQDDQATIPEYLEQDIRAAVSRVSVKWGQDRAISWAVDAINVAASKGRRDWGYIAGILNNWDRWGKVEKRKRSRDDPDRYVKGKFGKFVQR